MPFYSTLSVGILLQNLREEGGYARKCLNQDFSRVPANKELLIETVPVNKESLTGPVPVNN